MSYDINEINGMFTEDERRAGIVGIYFGADDNKEDDDGDDNNDDVEVDEAYEQQLKQESEERERIRLGQEAIAVKAIAGARSTVEIRQRMIRLLHKDHLEYAISRYALHEDLPTAYTAICKERNCLEILIKGMLRKNCNIDLTTKIVGEIENLCVNIRRNESNQIVYTRVSKIQKYIHKKVNLATGENSHLKLPVRNMKNLLSTARLHLSIIDLETKDHEYLEKIRSLTAQAVELEDSHSDDKVESTIYWNNTLSSKSYYPKWRVRHLRHIEHYFKQDIRSALTMLESLNNDEPVTSSRETAIRIYCDLIRT